MYLSKLSFCLTIHPGVRLLEHMVTSFLDPRGSVVKNPPAVDLIPGSGRSGERNGNPLQYSCLENAMDRGDWRATIHGVAKESDMI